MLQLHRGRPAAKLHSSRPGGRGSTMSARQSPSSACWLPFSRQGQGQQRSRQPHCSRRKKAQPPQGVPARLDRHSMQGVRLCSPKHPNPRLVCYQRSRSRPQRLWPFSSNLWPSICKSTSLSTRIHDCMHTMCLMRSASPSICFFFGNCMALRVHSLLVNASVLFCLQRVITFAS